MVLHLLINKVAGDFCKSFLSLYKFKFLKGYYGYKFYKNEWIG